MSYNFIRRKNRRKLKYPNDANYILHFIFVSNRSLCVTWRRRKNTLSKRSKHTTDKYPRKSSHLEWELTFFAFFFFFFSSTFGMAFFWNACRLDTIAMCVNVWYATINVHDLNAFLGIFSSFFSLLPHSNGWGLICSDLWCTWQYHVVFLPHLLSKWEKKTANLKN